MTAKKKLIRIDPASGIYGNSPYASVLTSGVSFAFAGPTEETRDGVKYRKQVSSFYTCREQLCEVPRSFLHKHNCITGYDYNRAPVDMEKYRLLIGVRGQEIMKAGEGNAKQRIFSAKRILNFLEDEVGWEKSVITTVKHTRFLEENGNSVFLLTGPKHWMEYPQLISLSALIIRCSCRLGKLDSFTKKEIFGAFKAWASSPENTASDRSYIGETRKHMLTFLSNIDKIFHKGSEYYYVDPNSTRSGWVGHGGISSLFKCTTGNEELTDKMKEFVFNVEK